MWPPTGLIPWFSKTEVNTYATIGASPFPLQGKPTQAQDVASILCLHHVILLNALLCSYELNTLDA